MASQQIPSRKEFLTEAEAQLLTVARDILDAIRDKTVESQSYGSGMLAQACEAAEQAIFEVLNTAKHRCSSHNAAFYLHRSKDEIPMTPFLLCQRCKATGYVEDDGVKRECPVCDGDPKITYEAFAEYAQQIDELLLKVRGVAHV